MLQGFGAFRCTNPYQSETAGNNVLREKIREKTRANFCRAEITTPQIKKVGPCVNRKGPSFLLSVLIVHFQFSTLPPPQAAPPFSGIKKAGPFMGAGQMPIYSFAWYYYTRLPFYFKNCFIPGVSIFIPLTLWDIWREFWCCRHPRANRSNVRLHPSKRFRRCFR